MTTSATEKLWVSFVRLSKWTFGFGLDMIISQFTIVSGSSLMAVCIYNMGRSGTLEQAANVEHTSLANLEEKYSFLNDLVKTSYY
jgi:hypothetical protein